MAQQLMDQDAIARGDVDETLRDVMEPETDADMNDEQRNDWATVTRAPGQGPGPETGVGVGVGVG